MVRRAAPLLSLALLAASCVDPHALTTTLLRRVGAAHLAADAPALEAVPSAERVGQRVLPIAQEVRRQQAAQAAFDADPSAAGPVALPDVPEAPAEPGGDDANEWGLGALDQDSDPSAPAGEDDSVGSGELAAEEEGADDVLASLARETWIFSEPSRRSRRIGYLRAGAIVSRKPERSGSAGCKGGWYRIEPRGFVCRGKKVTFDRFHPVVEASKKRPSFAGLPYDYVMSRSETPTLYGRIPSEAEQRLAEPDLGYHLRKYKATMRDPSFVALPEPGAVPPVLLYGQNAPGLADDKPRSASALVVGKARIRSGFALLGQFEEEGRRFGLTTDLSVLPLDRTRWVKPSTFEGMHLDAEISLPVGFVMKKHATRFTQTNEGRFVAGVALGHREAVALTGRQLGGGNYLETKTGDFVRAEDVRRIDPMNRAPSWATEGRRWIDVSLLKQSLVAYEGKRPVYVTLVSTGAGGIGDPKETHATIQGVFLVHTKHVTVTMDGDEAGDEFDLRDVPFVQYFNEGYALHAAYWHDDFGIPRSHGCVNLAPKDAAWLFGFTTPDVPANWHAALSLKKGTVVYTHP